MASSMVQSVLSKYSECLAPLGLVAISYLALKLSLAIWRGIKTFIFAKTLGLGTNLRKTGEWAVITGCTDGIGKEYALQIAAKGMNVVLISRTKSKLDELAQEIESKYKVKTLVVTADFSKGASIYPEMKERLSGLDIGVLVNNVGVGHQFPAYVHEVPNSDQHFVDMIALNVTSVTMMTNIVIGRMVEKKKGVIINLSSASGMVPCPLLSVYGASKAYSDFLSRSMHEEYKSKGIIIQSVIPYFVTTKLSKIRRASVMIPTPKTYVSSALATIGVASRTNGYWVHDIVGFLALSLPYWLNILLTKKTLNGDRVKAFKKLAAAAKKE